jgi:hypothetical protein
MALQKIPLILVLRLQGVLDQTALDISIHVMVTFMGLKKILSYHGVFKYVSIPVVHLIRITLSALLFTLFHLKPSTYIFVKFYIE